MTNINADVLAINSVRGDEYFTLEKDVRIIADNLIPEIGELNKPRTNCFVLSNGLLKNDFTIVRK